MNTVMADKLALKYDTAMRQTAAAHEARDLGLFEEIVSGEDRGGQLRADLVIRLLEPFEQVEMGTLRDAPSCRS